MWTKNQILLSFWACRPPPNDFHLIAWPHIVANNVKPCHIVTYSKKRKIFGVELDKNRIKHTNKGLSNTHFILGDINKVNIPKADVIVLMHVLHHLDYFKQQQELLRVCWSKLRKKGKLIIIEVEPRASLKYLTSVLVDHFLVAWLFERKLYSAIYFRKKNDWKKLLDKIGFKTNSYVADKNMPFSHIIFECSKP